MMIEFAKIKCKEMQEAIIENVEANIEFTGEGSEDYDAVVDKDSILNAYDLDNIK